MGKENVVFIQDGILFSCKKKEILPFVTTWMNREGIMVNKISDREKQIVYIFTYMWNSKMLKSQKLRVG